MLSGQQAGDCLHQEHSLLTVSIYVVTAQAGDLQSQPVAEDESKCHLANRIGMISISKTAG